MPELRAISGKRRLRELFATFRKDEDGANAVEFALVAPVFIALLVGIIQIFLVFFGQQLLQQVLAGGRVIQRQNGEDYVSVWPKGGAEKAPMLPYKGW